MIAIAVGAGVAGIALFWSMRSSAQVWKLREQPAVNHETLEDMLAAAERDPATFGRQLVQLYRNLLGHAQDVNERRAAAVDSATTAVGVLSRSATAATACTTANHVPASVICPRVLESKRSARWNS